MFVVYLGVVAAGVFGPSPGDLIKDAERGARRIGAEVRSTVAGTEEEAAPPRPAGGDLVAGLDGEDIGNILMFVPFGLLVPTRWPRWRWWTVPAGVALSSGIELTQRFLSWRSPSLSDVQWNSVGAAVGFALWLLASTLRHRRAPAR